MSSILRERQVADLVRWMKQNHSIITRDREGVSEAAIRASKNLGYRVTRADMEDVAITLGFTFPKAAVIPPPPPAPPPTPAESPEDELVKMAADFNTLKARIIEQSGKVAEAQAFANEAAGMLNKEQVELENLTREQLRIRKVIKEAMEI